MNLIDICRMIGALFLGAMEKPCDNCPCLGSYYCHECEHEVVS